MGKVHTLGGSASASGHGKKAALNLPKNTVAKRGKYEDKLTALYRHALHLSEATGIDDIIHRTIDAMEFALGFDHADIRVVEDGWLRCKEARGMKVTHADLPLHGPGLTVKAANSRMTVRVSDTRKEASYVDPIGVDWKGPPSILSELAVPVVVENASVAVLNVGSTQLNAITDDDQTLLETLAIHVASSIRRLVDLESLRRAEQHLEELVVERTEELSSARERLDYVIRSNPAVIYSGKPLADLSDWEYAFVSDRLVSMLGYEPEELAGHPEFWNSHVHPDDLEVTPEAVQTLWRQGHHTFEYRFRHKDGSYRWIRDEASVSRDSEGKPIEVYGCWTDITDRKQAEQALTTSERKYRELFEALPISLWEEDLTPINGYVGELRSKGITNFRQYFNEHPDEIAECFSNVKVLSVNDATLRLYGAREIEDIASVLKSMVKGEIRDVLKEEILAFAEGKTQFTSRIHNTRIRGETKNVSVICNVVPGYEKTLGKVLVCVVDLTPQRKLEKELRSTRNQLEHVLASNPAVLYLEKPLPDLSDTVSTFVSESATSVLGFEPENFLGEPGLNFWRSRIHPDDLTQYWAQLPSLWRDGHHTFEYRFLHSDGTYRWIREEYKLIRDADERILDIVSVAVDVTERMELYEKLAKAERLAAIGKTTAMVGHDLRNPLQGIAGALYLLRADFERRFKEEGNGVDVEDTLDTLNMADESIGYMNKIVSDLQDYAAPIHPERTATNMSSLLDEALSAIHVPANVKVSVNVTEPTNILTLDPDLMKRVLTNLITNAIQAMQNGGQLNITTQKTGGEALIIIQDTGIGMKKEVTDKLFEPFFTTKARGQGLGLAACKRLVEAQDGTINVQSEVGKGSIFTVRIPTTQTTPTSSN
jgi:hypothetical protein